jgi:hypothetical protein
MFGTFAFSLGGKKTADVTLLRGLGAPFQVLQSGEVSNQIRIKIANRSPEERSYQISVVSPQGLTMIAPENPLVVDVGSSAVTAVFLNAAPADFVNGELEIVLAISDGVDFEKEMTYRLLGPAGGVEP